MKCISKKIIVFLVFVLLVVAFAGSNLNNHRIKDYEKNNYHGKSMKTDNLFSTNLCVSASDIEQNLFQTEDDFHAVLLADLNEKQFLVGDFLHEKIYPASTTKLMTLYVALKHKPKTDVIEISKNAVDIPWDSSKAGLSAGDKISWEDLLYGLMLPSGNDAALAVAEAVSGTVDDFVKLMNKEASKLGATNTHFVSPHGYHHKKHYTTVYDLYLILNAAIKDEMFTKIISEDTYDGTITDVNGYSRKVTWYQTNLFIAGTYDMPEHIEFMGGKTGTTNEAGSCLSLYVKNEQDKEYIAIIMGSESKPILYENMAELLSLLSN